MRCARTVLSSKANAKLELELELSLGLLKPAWALCEYGSDRDGNGEGPPGYPALFKFIALQYGSGCCHCVLREELWKAGRCRGERFDMLTQILYYKVQRSS